LQREVLREETRALLQERPGGEGFRDRLERLLGFALP